MVRGGEKEGGSAAWARSEEGRQKRRWTYNRPVEDGGGEGAGRATSAASALTEGDATSKVLTGTADHAKAGGEEAVKFP